MVQDTTNMTNNTHSVTDKIDYVEPSCCYGGESELEEEDGGEEEEEGNAVDDVDDVEGDTGNCNGHGRMDEPTMESDIRISGISSPSSSLSLSLSLLLVRSKPKIPVDRQWIQKLLRKYWYTSQLQHQQLSSSSSSSVPVLLSLPPDDMKLYAYICAPMVDQSDLPFRLLCRQYGCNIAYTPMIHAKLFQTSQKYRHTFLPMHVPFPTTTTTTTSSSTSSIPFTSTHNNNNTDITSMDRPLIGQICGSSIEHVIPTAIQISPYVDAIDINCGCPQNIAKRGNYGAFLLEQEEYLLQLVQTLTSILSIPVTVKVRLLPPPLSTTNNNNVNTTTVSTVSTAVTSTTTTPNTTSNTTTTVTNDSDIQLYQRNESVRRSMILYEKLIHYGNVHMICLHGRTRHQKGVQTGPADWDAIREVVQTFGTTIPIMANGSIANPQEIRQCIRYTNVDGVMSSEALLEYPPLFHNLVREDYYNHFNNNKTNNNESTSESNNNDGSTSHGTVDSTTNNTVPYDHTVSTTMSLLSPIQVDGMTLAQQYYDIATQYPPNVHGQGSNNIKVIKIHIHRFCHYYLQNDMPLRQLLINAMTMEALLNVIVLLQQKYGSSSSSSSSLRYDPASLSWYFRHRGKVRDCFGLITNTNANNTETTSVGGPVLLQAQMEHERTVKSNIDIVMEDDAADCFNVLFQTNTDDDE
jgi:tRNA-dihydrouridine synthase 1